MSEVSTFRLYLLRAMYLFMAVGLAIFKLPALRHPRDPVAPGQRGSQRARRVRALGGAWHPLPAQDAATAFVRVRVEVHLGCGFRAAPIAFR